MSSRDRPVLAPDLARAVAQAGVDSTLEGRALQDALRAAIATRGGYCWWTVDHTSWVVTLHSPEEQDFYGRSRIAIVVAVVALLRARVVTSMRSNAGLMAASAV